MAPTHMAHIRRWIVQSPPVEWAIMQLRELLIGALKQGPVPNHVAFVMDGNRRFARSHRMETVEGHNLGFEALAKVCPISSGELIAWLTQSPSDRYSRSATRLASRS